MSLGERIIGKTIASIELSSDKEEIDLTFSDRTRHRFRVEGECCSTSWVEHLELPPDVIGATITAVQEHAPISNTMSDALEAERAILQEQSESDVVKHHYYSAIATNRGQIWIEYRNSSNGYYGGSIVDVALEPL